MTLNRTSLTLFFCVSFFMSFSQMPFEFKTSKTKANLKGNEGNWVSQINVDNQNVKASISFVDRDSAYYFLVDKDFHIENNYSIPKLSIAENYYSGSYDVILQQQSENVFVNYLHKPNESAIYIEQIHFDLHNSIFYQFLDFNRREKFITAFEEDNHMYFLTVVKGTNKIKLYKDDEKNASEISLAIPTSIGELDLENAIRDTKVIKENKETDLNTVTSKAKLYIEKHGRLFLTIDNSYKFTILFSIDLGSKTAKSDVFTKNLFYCNNVERIDLIQTNSFLYDDKLIQGTFCPKDFALSIKNTDKDSALYTFHAEIDSSINFASSDLIKREQNTVLRVGLFSNKKDPLKLSEKELKAKDFFKAVNRHEIAFMVTKVNNCIVLKIGESHSLYTNTGGGGGFYGGGFGAGASMPRIPTYYGGYSSKTGQSETYFKTVFNNLDSAKVLSVDVDTKSDKIDSYEAELLDTKADSTAFDFNNETYYFYWDKFQGKFIIAKL